MIIITLYDPVNLPDLDPYDFLFFKMKVKFKDHKFGTMIQETLNTIAGLD